MNKILITIQGRTLILYYQAKHGLARNDTGRAGYIEVLPSDELSKFDLKGLTPEMFCVNITDMVNIRGLFAGQVENERQIAIARWALNREEYLQATRAPLERLTHQQIVNLLMPLPGFMQVSNNQYIDFAESLVPHHSEEQDSFSGYRLSIANEDIEGNVSSYAYYSLDTHTPAGWQGTPPPQADYGVIRIAIENKLQAIRGAGVEIAQVYDETDYALVGSD